MFDGPYLGVLPDEWFEGEPCGNEAVSFVEDEFAREWQVNGQAARTDGDPDTFLRCVAFGNSQDLRCVAGIGDGQIVACVDRDAPNVLPSDGDIVYFNMLKDDPSVCEIRIGSHARFGIADPKCRPAAPGDGDAMPGDGDGSSGDGDAMPGDGDAPPGDGDAMPGDGDGSSGDGDAMPGDGDGSSGDGDAVPGDGDGPPPAGLGCDESNTVALEAARIGRGKSGRRGRGSAYLFRAGVCYAMSSSSSKVVLRGISWAGYGLLVEDETGEVFASQSNRRGKARVRGLARGEILFQVSPLVGRHVVARVKGQ